MDVDDHQTSLAAVKQRSDDPRALAEYARSGSRFVSSSSTASSLSTISRFSADDIDSPPSSSNSSPVRVSSHRRVRRSISVPKDLTTHDDEYDDDDSDEAPEDIRRQFSIRVPFLPFKNRASSPHSRPQKRARESRFKDPAEGLAYSDVSKAIASLSISASPATRPNPKPCHPALFVPEILTNILSYVDCENDVPMESTQRRRRPMSLRHALIMYGNPEAAKAAWEQFEAEGDSTGVSSSATKLGGLHSSLLVCRFWNVIAQDVLHEKVHFRSQAAWDAFVAKGKSPSGILRQETKKPSLLVLHKITSANQYEIDSLEGLGGRLSWLEFYTCPSIVPTKKLLSGDRLKRVVLPGCSRVSDRVVALIADCCRQLEHLDLRACDHVSDRGIKYLAHRCRQLKLLNVGRTQRGDLISYRGIKHIARFTAIETLGLAGTDIDDKAMWELALRRGPRLQRLSLNNCQMLTNSSIPHILAYMPNLCVLELRGCIQISDMKPIVQFKRYRELCGHPPLIEGCEIIELRMKEAEWLLEVETSRQVISDCLEWIYSPDSDVPFDQLAKPLQRDSGATA